MLELKDVHKEFAGGKVGLSIDSLVIPDGEIVGILGENGSGKTTLLKTIMALGALSYGEVLVDGMKPQRRYADMAFITEEGSCPPDMTADQFADFLADYYAGFNRERYGRLLAFFELEPDRRIGKLSRGQRSKLEICAGFAKGAKYILMDEPFLGKDMFARRDFLKLMVTSLREDETFLIATHLVDEIEHVLDRAIVLRAGRVAADLYIDELADQGRKLEDVLAEVSGYRPDRFRDFLE